MKKPTINWSAIRREVSTGESYKVVGERYGVKPSRISMKAHRERWEIRQLRKMMGKAGPAWQTETVIKSIEAEVESLGKTMMTGSLRWWGFMVQVAVQISAAIPRSGSG